MYIKKMIVDRLTYGAYSDPSGVRMVACAINYLFIWYFAYRASRIRGNDFYWLLLKVVLMTIQLFFIVYDFFGVSTLWSFAFGAITRKTALDYAMFLAASSTVFVPWALRKKYPFLWPFPPRFFYTANMAHLVFVVLGYLSIPQGGGTSKS